MNIYFDRQGHTIDRDRFVRLFNDPDYQRVAQTHLPGDRMVSTVWLGINHDFTRAGRPIIFETMAFGPTDTPSGRDEIWSRRYATEEEAVRGHAEVVALVLGGVHLMTARNA